MKLTKNLKLTEFVPELVYKMYGDKSIWFINPQIVKVAQFVREYFDLPIYINTWDVKTKAIHSNYRESGFRPYTSSIPTLYSQHRLGNAIDIKIPGKKSEEIRAEIMDNFEVFYDMGIRAIEKDTPTWVHIDCRWCDKELFKKILEVGG